MKPRITLTLAAIAGTLFAYIWFVDRHQNTTREEVESSAKVLQLDRAKISRISIKNAGTQIELAKENGLWSLTQPVADRADAAVVDQLLSLLDNLRHDSKITPSAAGKEADQLKEFGLDESELSIKLSADGAKDAELLLGKDSAIEGKFYVRVQGQSAVYVIRNPLRNQLTRKPDEFRDHKLASIPTQSVQKLTVKTTEGELELEHKNGHWDLTKPMRARGADSKVNDLLAAVLNANLTQFLPAAPSPEQGLSEPRATFTLQVEGQSEPVILQIGATPAGDENKDKSFAKISTREAVTILPNNAFEPLLKTRPNDLRDRKLLRVESDIVDRITIEPAGKPPIVLARKGESWVQKMGDTEGALREGLATKLIADLQAAETVNFVADLAADLAPYGLVQPQLKIRLSSFASGNTAETQAGEKPILTVLFGSVEGDNGYAKLDDEPFIVATPKTLLASFPTELLDLLPSSTPEAVVEFKKEDVEGIQTAFAGNSTRAEKGADGWTVSGGTQASKAVPATSTKADPSAIEGFLDHLLELHAGRLTGTHESLVKALETPLLSITLTLAKAAPAPKVSISIGHPIKDGSFPATVTGKEGVFLLNEVNEDALERAITSLQPPSNLPPTSLQPPSTPPEKAPKATSEKPEPSPIPKSPAATTPK